MTKKPKTRGIFLLILGLIIYQFGLLATLQQATLISYLTEFLSIEVVEVVGVLLQLLGGFLIVAGLTSLISSIIAIQLENEMRTLGNEILSGVDERLSDVRDRLSDVRDLIARQRLSAAPQTQQTAARVCKFCGTSLGDEDFFCPKCGKAQK